MGLVGLFAVVAKEPEEPLRDYGHKRRGYQERLDLHVYKPRDGARRIVRVQGGENEVSRERRVDGYIRGLSVPYLADQDYVRVLPEYGPEAVCESQVHFGVNLYLVYPLNLVFYGVFDSDDFFVRRVNPFEAGV